MHYAESEFLTLEQAKLLANSFVNSQFGYASLIWMFTSKNSMPKVNQIHRRTLRVVYDDYNSTYEEPLASHNYMSIRQKYLKRSTIEVFKSLTNLNPEFMWPKILKIQNPQTSYFAERDRCATHNLFWAGEVSWNRDTPINVSCTKLKRRCCRGNFWCVFFKLLLKLHFK